MTKTLEIILAIVAEKKAKGVWPTHALEGEVTRRYAGASAELKELGQSGHIKLGRTINDRYIKIMQ